jgi:2-methylcitrate dehydratase PrpD
MLTHGLDATQIARVDVQTFRESAALLPGMPETTGQAQYSLAFALAAMMRHGQVGPDKLSGAGLKDPSVENLILRISVTEDAGYSGAFPARRLADFTVTLTDGTQYHTGEVEARGGPEAPLSSEELQAKLHLFAEPVLGKRRTEALWRMRERLTEPDATFADLIALVTPPA